jgi:hypothetical protein
MVTVFYTVEQFITDARSFHLSDDKLKEIHEKCNQEDFLSSCETAYSVVYFNCEEEFFGKTPDSIIELYELQNGSNLYAVLKNGNTLFFSTTIDDIISRSEETIRELAKNDAVTKIKDFLFQIVQKEHDDYFFAIQQKAMDEAQEALIIEMIERGVL